MQCDALCASIHASLPAEIRDLIYDKLITVGLEHHVMEARGEDGALRVSNNPLVQTSFFDPRFRMPVEPAVRRDCWRYSEYTGTLVGKEIAERWYRTGIFNAYAEDDLLEKFLFHDVWERGVLPAVAVRHIHLHLPNIVLAPDFFESQICHNVGLLTRLLNKKANIIIKTWMLTQDGRQSFPGNMRQVVETLRILGPIIYRLRGLGYSNVRVLDRSTPLGQNEFTHVFDQDERVFESIFKQVRNRRI